MRRCLFIGFILIFGILICGCTTGSPGKLNDSYSDSSSKSLISAEDAKRIASNQFPNLTNTTYHAGLYMEGTANYKKPVWIVMVENNYYNAPSNSWITLVGRVIIDAKTGSVIESSPPIY